MYIDQNSVRKNTFKDLLEIALMIDFFFRALYKVQRPAGKSDVRIREVQWILDWP